MAPDTPKSRALLRGARNSIKSAHRILNERDAPPDYHALSGAARQAQQAVAELYELIGYLQGKDEKE